MQNLQRRGENFSFFLLLSLSNRFSVKPEKKKQNRETQERKKWKTFQTFGFPPLKKAKLLRQRLCFPTHQPTLTVGTLRQWVLLTPPITQPTKTLVTNNFANRHRLSIQVGAKTCNSMYAAFHTTVGGWVPAPDANRVQQLEFIVGFVPIPPKIKIAILIPERDKTTTFFSNPYFLRILLPQLFGKACTLTKFISISSSSSSSSSSSLSLFFCVCNVSHRQKTRTDTSALCFIFIFIFSIDIQTCAHGRSCTRKRDRGGVNF